MKIMAALDRSEYAHFVLRKAIKTALQQKAKLDIVMVVDNNELSVAEVTKIARSHQQAAISHGVKAKVRIFTGKAAEEIIKYQKTEQLDMIVLGRRSHKQEPCRPIGAVVLEVATFATCTVMIVRSMEERDYVKNA